VGAKAPYHPRILRKIFHKEGEEAFKNYFYPGTSKGPYFSDEFFICGTLNF